LKNFHIQIFSDYLLHLSQFLKKIETSVAGDPRILHAKLAEDMFPLILQAQIAANFSLRTCCPIAGVAVISFSESEQSFSAIQRQITATLNYLNELDSSACDLSVGEITDMAGPVEVTLPCLDFLHRFALPNFFFHLSMVYAIARSAGIGATKGDFDGFHQYPTGFSFDDS